MKDSLKHSLRFRHVLPVKIYMIDLEIFLMRAASYMRVTVSRTMDSRGLSRKENLNVV